MVSGEPEWVNELKEQIRQRQDPWVVLEGKQAVEAAVAGWWDVSGILAGENCEWEPPDWSGLELLRRPEVFFEDFASISSHGGVLGLAKLPDETANLAGLIAELDSDALVMVCPRLHDGLQVGLVIRNAAALGAKAVIFGREGVSPFEQVSVKASSGAIFRVPVRVADGGQILRCLKMAGFQLIGRAQEENSVPLDRLELDPGRHAVIIGAEGEGLGSFWKAACDSLVHVPMESGQDTLDPAAASSALLWEVGRRRRAQAENES